MFIPKPAAALEERLSIGWFASPWTRRKLQKVFEMKSKPAERDRDLAL